MPTIRSAVTWPRRAAPFRSPEMFICGRRAVEDLWVFSWLIDARAGRSRERTMVDPLERLRDPSRRPFLTPNVCANGA